MGIVVWGCTKLPIGSGKLLILQVVIGVSSYLIFSIIFKLKGFQYCFAIAKDIVSSRKNR